MEKKRKPNSSRPVSGKKTTGRTAQNKKKKPSSSLLTKREREEARRRRQRMDLILGLSIGIAAALLIFCCWKLYSIFSEYSSGEKEYDELQQYVTADVEEPTTEDFAASDEEEAPARMPRVDLVTLKGINDEVVGWIEIPDTVISYPILHTTDNIYYLHHTFRKEENRAGAIFIEARNQPDFSGLHTIIYGHNMKNGSMFAGIKDYAKQDFYDEHPYIYIDLEDGAHCYQIFSCHEAEVTDITYTIGYRADDAYTSFLDDLKEASLYDTGVEVSAKDMVITLSTCTKGGEKRFVVHAKKIY